MTNRVGIMTSLYRTDRFLQAFSARLMQVASQAQQAGLPLEAAPTERARLDDLQRQAPSVAMGALVDALQLRDALSKCGLVSKESA